MATDTTGYYHFDDAAGAAVITRHDTPTPWINYLSNGRLHAFVSQAGGGLVWYRSPLTQRLTRYRGYNLPLDSPGFYLYLRESDGACWSPATRPCETPLERWEARHLPGRTRFAATRGKLSATQELFICPDLDVMVWEIEVTNAGTAAVDLDLFAYTELSQLDWKGEVEWGCYLKHHLSTRYDVGMGALLSLNHPHAEGPLLWFAGSHPVVSYSGDRDAFVGDYRSERNPIAIERNHCGDQVLDCGEPCAALHNRVRLAPGGREQVRFFLGAMPGALKRYPQALAETGEILARLRCPGGVEEQSAKLDAWWNEHFGAFACTVPDPDVQRQINRWTPLQCVHTARYSRSISFAASGIRGVGFRDTCQDMLAIVGRRPAWARESLLGLLTQQFRDGHVVHTYFPEEGRPPWTSVHCDDHLWLPLLAHALVAETGDLALLDRTVPWLAADAKGADGAGTVWEHLLAATAFTEAHLGAHDIPLILRSDWNDIIGKFAAQGRGESLFAAQQYVHALRLLRELAIAARPDDVRHLETLLAKQAGAIAACAWDGGWWRRGFDDDGQPIGSQSSPFGKMWINTQNWAVIARCGTPEQWRTALDAMDRMLGTELGLRKLAPSFQTYPEVSDPFSGYSPGCGENGAIFCHANTWAIIAAALLGDAQRAWRYYRQLVPHLACAKVGVRRYQGEPYAYASNIVGPENSKFGWANVTQVTGTAAWMDVAATQYLLGIRPELTGLRIDPCIPANWPGFSVHRIYRGCAVDIRVSNPGAGKGVSALSLDDQVIDLTGGPIVPAALLAGRRSAKVAVRLR